MDASWEVAGAPQLCPAPLSQASCPAEGTGGREGGLVFAPGAAPTEPHPRSLCPACAADRSARSSPTCWPRTDRPWGTRGPTPSWSRASRAV